MRVGVYGGTFDPIHVGHLIIGELAREALELDRLLFVVAKRPPHKVSESITPAEFRLEMVRLATLDNPFFEPSDIEIRRGGVSYTVETLQALSDELELPRENLFFLMGADSLVDFPNWRQPDRILELATVVALRRPGVDLSDVDPEYLRRVRLLPTPLLEISATNIRQRVSRGCSIRYLVPEPVVQYIREHKLYLTESGPVGKKPCPRAR
ncbi:MAG: nicotinate-nucleotide adenylyltransferase [Calditrichaeota bacterium]|nr:nicotinate-nucleotide adenylyltransferase [Calditrichota bacterium]